MKVTWNRAAIILLALNVVIVAVLVVTVAHILRSAAVGVGEAIENVVLLDNAPESK
jgi:uncharacterized protein YpmS